MKKLLVLLLGLCIASFAFSQMSVNPSHPFYSDAQSWLLRGVVEKLPPVRPYPVLTIKDILEQVQEKGNERDKVLASGYYEELTEKALYVNLAGEFVHKTISSETDGDIVNSAKALAEFYQHIEGDKTFFKDLVSFGYKMGLVWRNSDNENFYLPYAQKSLYDSIQDPSSVGPLFGYLDADDVIALGNKNIFLQAGIFRNGTGQFLGKGITLNDTDYHKGTISLTYMGKKLRYNQQMSVIGASSSYNGDKLSPSKFMAYHSLSYDLFSWFTFTYYENIVYGKRFDFSYLLPAPYMACQGIGGNSDNLQMGLVFDVKPAQGFIWSTDIFVDDFNVNQMVKLNLDTKLRLAFQTGLIYVPDDSFMKKIGLDWTIITPYTYSHWDYDTNTNMASITQKTVNYQNYTNSGLKMGSLYEPNSSAVNFWFNTAPVKNLSVDIGVSLIRHANVTESLETEDAIRYITAEPGIYSTDGSVFEHANFANYESETGDHVDGAWNKLNMFTQEHQMYTVQGNLGIGYTFPKIRNYAEVSLKLGWTFEFVHNYGIDRHIYPGQGSACLTMDGENQKTNSQGELLYTYNGRDDWTADELVNKFKKDWVDGLSDRIHNYFSAGVSVRF
ncbi:MAG: hypothetical protein J5780_05525 [Treponema sp.]|nr:hypothetical protein [Treponema sp.]